MSQYNERELEAMFLCTEAIKNLSDESRERVIEYLQDWLPKTSSDCGKQEPQVNETL